MSGQRADDGYNDITNGTISRGSVCNANKVVIVIYNNLKLGGRGFVVDGKQVTPGQVEEYLARQAAVRADLQFIVKSTAYCPHRHLLTVMRICRKAGMEPVSQVSM